MCSQSSRNFSGAPTYWAHHAVVFAIAQLSCFRVLLKFFSGKDVSSPKKSWPVSLYAWQVFVLWKLECMIIVSYWFSSDWFKLSSALWIIQTQLAVNFCWWQCSCCKRLVPPSQIPIKVTPMQLGERWRSLTYCLNSTSVTFLVLVIRWWTVLFDIFSTKHFLFLVKDRVGLRIHGILVNTPATRLFPDNPRPSFLKSPSWEEFVS